MNPPKFEPITPSYINRCRCGAGAKWDRIIPRWTQQGGWKDTHVLVCDACKEKAEAKFASKEQS